MNPLATDGRVWPSNKRLAVKSRPIVSRPAKYFPWKQDHSTRIPIEKKEVAERTLLSLYKILQSLASYDITFCCPMEKSIGEKATNIWFAILPAVWPAPHLTYIRVARGAE